MAGPDYFGETVVQPRDHIPVNTSHTITRFHGNDNVDYPQPRLIFSRLT